jgi:hypothetical protein
VLGMKQALLRTIVVFMLLAFAGIGIAHTFRPDYFLKRSGVRRAANSSQSGTDLAFR